MSSQSRQAQVLVFGSGIEGKRIKVDLRGSYASLGRWAAVACRGPYSGRSAHFNPLGYEMA